MLANKQVCNRKSNFYYRQSIIVFIYVLNMKLIMLIWQLRMFGNDIDNSVLVQISLKKIFLIIYFRV